MRVCTSLSQSSWRGNALRPKTTGVSGGSAPPQGESEFNDRLAAGWRDFHKNKVHLTTLKIPHNIRRSPKKLLVSPIITFGNCRWLWNPEVRSKLHATILRMVRWMLGRRRTEGWTGIASLSKRQEGGSGRKNTSRSLRQKKHRLHEALGRLDATRRNYSPQKAATLEKCGPQPVLANLHNPRRHQEQPVELRAHRAAS